MSDDIDRLGRLHELKTTGAISEEEYNAQKSLILRAVQTAPTNGKKSEPDGPEPVGSLAKFGRSQDDNDLSRSWKLRFDAFDRFGRPKTLATNGGLATYGLADQIGIIFNFWAVLFGVLYLAYLGLWKRAFLVILISLTVDVLTAVSPKGENPVIGVGFGCLFAGLFANYGYYTKYRTGMESWRVWDSLR